MSPVSPPTKILDSLILMQLEIEGPLHGYGLATTFEEKFSWKPSQTAIYNSLKAMEQENLVEYEEKIESGRVQKIYAITKKGKDCINETHKLMKENMIKNFVRMSSVMQMLVDSGQTKEAESIQKAVHEVFKSFREISLLTIKLIQKEPETTQRIIAQTLDSLKKIASDYNIEFKEDEENGQFFK